MSHTPSPEAPGDLSLYNTPTDHRVPPLHAFEAITLAGLYVTPSESEAARQALKAAHNFKYIVQHDRLVAERGNEHVLDHAKRVAYLGLLLAQRVKLAQDTELLIAYAQGALWHDYGKAGPQSHEDLELKHELAKPGRADQRIFARHVTYSMQYDGAAELHPLARTS